MHMISTKDLNSFELETVTTSRSPTMVITANGEVQTYEEATVHVKELNIFLTMKVLEDTPAVLSLGKFCDEHGYSYEWINGQKPHFSKNGIRIQCNTENFVPIVVPGLSSSSSSSFPSSTSMTPSRQEIDHPTSSSSSSTSPTMTLLRQEIDHSRSSSSLSTTPMTSSTETDDSDHVEPRVKLYSPREESFPIPLKYIDVSRTTHTNLDVVQESRIDDYWNIDGSRDLSDSWTGFTQFTLLEEKAPDGYMWSGWRLTRKQLTSRPDHQWPELWKSMGNNAKLKEKQKWSNEKFHLENARKLRGIYFIDSEDKEFKETIKNGWRKLETPMAPAMPCKTCNKNKYGETGCKTKWFQV